MTTSFMGGQIRRREDPRLITGSATYVDDVVLPGLAYVAILRSPHPHARILSIDASKALARPGVLAVVTGEEVADLVSEQESEGEAGPPPRTALAVGVVRYVGDPVAAVVATAWDQLAGDRALAEDALEDIIVDYEELPGVGDPECAMEPGAPRIHDYAENNIDTRRTFSAGDVDKAFADADATVSLRLVEQRLSPNPMEPRGIVARYEGGSDQLTIWNSTQWAHGVRDAVCKALKLPQNKVRVIAPEVGGGFGCKIPSYPEDVLIAYLARTLNRRLGTSLLAVKWIETRTEHLQATIHGRSQIAYLDLAATRDGGITGLRLRLIVDSGAYGASWAGEISAGMITGCYHIENVESETLTVLTNKTPLGAYRGAGRPESAYYIERGIDALADKLGLDPAEIRRRNFIPPDAFPYSLPDWPSFDSGAYGSTLDAALTRSGYHDLQAEQERLRAEGRLIGIGLSSYVEICGFGWETATVRIEADGSVSVYTGISPHGQGQETTFAQIAADLLGVPPEQVNVIYGDTALGSGFGTMGSRGTAVGGPAVYNASQTLREKMRQIAAHQMEVAPDDLELAASGLEPAGWPLVPGHGSWRVKGVPDRSLTIAEIAETAYAGDGLPDGMEPGLTAVHNFRPESFTAPFGTHVVCVEVDRETGHVDIRKYLTVDDCGTVVSPQLVQGQVHGGIAQGIAQAIFEEVVYDGDGRLLTGSFVDYTIPTAGDLPLFETGHTCTPTPYNDLGIKGIGEAATIGSTPAVVNAVVDALSPLGVTHLDMPLTPEKLWQAINSREL